MGEDSNPQIKFGGIAIKMGLISKNNLEFILEEQESDKALSSRKPKLVGDMLIEAGLITGKQRDSVLKEQKKLLKKIEKTIKNKEELLLEPELVSHGLKLQITADFLAAFLIKTDQFDKRCTVKDIKDILIDKDIISGVVTDPMIISFLKSPVFKEKPFRIAKGIVPVQGEDAKIDFFFETEHLKAGGVDMDGQIDFKDRGIIPQVEKDMVLAIKTPMIEAEPGKNIYGETVSVEPVCDIQIKAGKGTQFSKNNLQVSAAVKGHPKISHGGEICVQEEYIIDGDVDYETGHIDYEGNIHIKGSINSGFKVRGNNIKANAIDDGIIDAQGNIKISDGINSGKILVNGDLSATFIHKSHISCVGDVVVKKEIIDATIENRGRCTMEAGKIISSKITSKMGVFVKNIGTEKGKPSTIRVGLDIFSEKELQENKISIANFNEALEDMIAKQNKNEKKREEIEETILKYTKIKNNSHIFKQRIISKINSLKKGGEEIKYPEAIKKKLMELKADGKLAMEKLELCSKTNNNLIKQIKELTQKIGKQKLKIKNLEFARENILKWIKNNPGNPVIEARGIIMAKTIIQGISSKKILEEEVKNVKLKEIRDTAPGVGQDSYKIEIIH